MRSCAACFYFRAVSSDAGECYNRPPFAHINAYNDANAGYQIETWAIRPPVRKDDFCAFFAHKSKKDDKDE